MGTVERAGDATSEVESGEEEEIVGGGELAEHLMKRWVAYRLSFLPIRLISDDVLANLIITSLTIKIESLLTILTGQMFCHMSFTSKSYD